MQNTELPSKGSKSFKVVHQHVDRIIIEAAFDNYPDAAVHLANSIFMEPFIVIDEGQLDFGNLTPEEARRFAVERIAFKAPRAQD
ncbi:MAG: hypothetical protein HYY48_03200 [Gammaproteobacteria bacterium]|nr:hypothetical protein [Gammaproteobacteria bacterium]